MYNAEMFAKVSVFTLLCALLLQACSTTPVQINHELTPSVESTVIASQEATTQPTATIQPTLQPTATVGPTATIWPPIFVSWSLKDIRDLDSFVVTINEKNTINGKLTELNNTIGYIKEPYIAYDENKYASGMDQLYVIDGWTYSLTGSGDWYISAGLSDDVFLKADIPAGNTEKLAGAQFVAQEDYHGIPAYHFVQAPVNSPETNSQVEGDFYLAKEGNYVLYSHSKETSSQDNFTQVYEVTETLSSINQLTEIKLPSDMEKMVAAAKLPTDMGLPVPGNSTVDRMIRYKNGIGVDLYFFTNPKISPDEFLNFYRNLPSTDGWTVSHVGHVNLHQDDCEFTRECVIIDKGSTQVILYYYGGSIRAEFDWPHLYSPL